MAEEDSANELEELKKQLQSLLSRYSSDELRGDSKAFCSEYCKLVEGYASRWQVPLPQLRILEMALCYFTQASTSFTSNCDHVSHTLSSMALSVFELLLFFEEKDFLQEPLKNIAATFQECHLVLARHQNVHMHQVECLVQAGGAWASSALQAILSESSLPQNEADVYLSSELPVFLELRVRYLLSRERVSEALALAKCCARHPTAGQHLFFLQVYLTWLHKTSQHDRLHKEVADFNGKDAVHIICSLECEETDELLLALSRAFLCQQLRRGDMYYLCDLVFVWSKLHSRLKTSKQALLEESRQLMLSATNVNSIFPFIRVILQELGESGVQFCVELCANALDSCLPCDVLTKSLIYKTIAGLLPDDLEVCRACALLVFFLERTVEAYKMMYVLYMHPDQEYSVDCSPIRNHVRFETLQVLKKDLYFDPEFWNLIALRTNCLKLMSDKEVGAALEELMEEKWVPSYCARALACASGALAGQKGLKGAQQAAAEKRQQKVCHKQGDVAPKRLKVGQGRTSVGHPVKKKGSQGSRYLKETAAEPLRRSFWQLDRKQDGVGYGPQRRTTRLSEKNPPKRRIRKPRWLLEDSGALEENNLSPRMRTHRLRHQKDHHSSVVKRLESASIKNNAKHKVTVNDHLKARENNGRHHKGLASDSVKPARAPQVILELSLPDNELMCTEDACNRHRGYPQMLFYRPTVKLPATSPPVKVVHRKEVILRARDMAMFVQQLHCYARRQKGKVSAVHGSVSTITRSSVQGSPPKDPDAEVRGTLAERCDSPAIEQVPQAPSMTTPPKTLEETLAKSVSQSVGFSEEPAVEMKVTIASQTPTAAKAPQPPATDVSPSTDDATVSEALPPDGVKDGAGLPSSDVRQNEEKQMDSSPKEKKTPLCETSESVGAGGRTEPFRVNDDISALTLVTEMVAELSPAELLHSPKPLPSSPPPQESAVEASCETRTASSCSAQEQQAPTAGVKEEEGHHDDPETLSDTEEVENEESKLEFCCTFCNKVFKGSRVVRHAMFHFRKDECMFCSTVFKDDLLAMMHLSDHIEKLKKAQQNSVSDTKDAHKPKTSSKAKVTNTSLAHRSSGRLKKSTAPPEALSQSQPESHPHESRALRSNDKRVETSVHKEKQSKHAKSKAPLHKLNGNIGKKNLGRCVSSSAAKQKLSRSGGDSAAEERRHETAASTADVSVEETVRCPVEGCSWFTDVSKTRVGLLYHALDDHYGNDTLLEMSFQVANNKCSICMRVLRSFEHFQHHVERHRLTPRHPCPHQGCTARFKTGVEMRHHARRHSPLQAECCRPGCSQLFICLWALNLHEREHYAPRAGKRPKKANVETAHSHPERKRHKETHAAATDRRKLRQPPAEESTVRSDSQVLKKPNRRRRRSLTATRTLQVLSSKVFKRNANARHRFKRKQVRVARTGRKLRGRPPKAKVDGNGAATPDSGTPKHKVLSKDVGEVADESKKPANKETKRDHRKEKGTVAKGSVPNSHSASGSQGKKQKMENVKVETKAIEKSREETVGPTASEKPERSSKDVDPRVTEPAGEDGTAGTANASGEEEKKPLDQSQSSGEGHRPAAASLSGDTNQVVQTQRDADETAVARICPPTEETDAGRGNPRSTSSSVTATTSKETDSGRDVPSSTSSAVTTTTSKETDAGRDVPSSTSSAVTATSSAVTTTTSKETDAGRDVPSSTSSGEPVTTKTKPPPPEKKKIRKQAASVPPKAKTAETKRKRKDAPSKVAEVKVESSDGGNLLDLSPKFVLTTSASTVVNGKPEGDGRPPSLCMDTLAEYGKKPYMRVPPTAYLDERFITMPKRRKETCEPRPAAPPCERQPLPPAAPLRQRCVKCFTTFSCGEELQSHVQLQTCSNVFGFDSDEEGNS